MPMAFNSFATVSPRPRSRLFRFLAGVIFLDLGVGFFLTISSILPNFIQPLVACFAAAAGAFFNAKGLEQGRNAVAHSPIAGIELSVEQPQGHYGKKGQYDGGGAHLFSEKEKCSHCKDQHEVDDLFRRYLLRS